MSEDVPDEPAETAEIRIERTLSRRPGVVSSIGEDLASGSAVVVKEHAHGVRSFPRIDRRRSVWTRLVLPAHVRLGSRTTALVRPYLGGYSLEEALAGGPRSVGETLTVAIDVLRALDALHGMGLIHGALKPANVILDADQPGRAWLVDPAPTPADGAELPAVGGLEDARFRSPEQTGVLHDDVGPASDLYSLGVVLFASLAGAPVHAADDAAELERAHVTAPAPSIRALGVEIPRVLDEVVARLLRKDPRDRYASASGALDDLVEIERRVSLGERDPALVVGIHDQRSTPTQPGLVGRADELAALGGILERSREGHGSLVRLEARSGDGKTRFLDEVAILAAQHGDRVLRAEARELEAPRPFAMLDRLASSLLTAAADDPGYADRIAAATGRWGTELRTVLPSLAQLLEAADERGFGRSAESRVLDALATLFDALGSADRPAVLLLDDCQWADDLSLHVVERWSAHDPGERFVTVVAAVRSDEVAGDHPARRWDRARTIGLDPLDRSRTRELVSSMIGPVPDEAEAMIRRLTGGRPFAVTTIVRAMVEAGALQRDAAGWRIDAHTLTSLTTTGEPAAMVLRRLGRLPDETLGFLSAAAVLGQHAAVAEVARLARIDVARTGEIVEEARRAGLIFPTDGRDEFTFVHDKVREGALGRLSPQERRTLHLAAAELIEQTRPEDLFDIAYHFDQGGAPERALPHALEAARSARARQALESAETMYRIAVRGIAPGDLDRRARVAEDLGEVLMLRGAYEEAAACLEEARELATDRLQVARIEGTIGELAFKRDDVRTAAWALERALGMLGRRVPRRRLALVPLLVWELAVQASHSLLPRLFVGRRSLEDGTNDLLASRFHGRLGYAWWFERGKVATLWTHFRSLNIAERYPPTPELAQAYSEHAPAMMLIPWHRRGVRYAQRSHAIRVELGDLWGQGQSLHFWGAGLYAASEFERSLVRMREALELLERTGDQWEVNNCRLQIAMALYRLGDLAGAVEQSSTARAAGLEIGDPQARGIGLECWAKATDGRIAAEVLEAELERSSADVLTIASVKQAEGAQLLGAGDPLGAVDAFEESHRLFRQAGMKNAGVSPVRPWLLTALRRAAEATPAVGRRRRRALLRRARAIGRQAGRRARLYRNDLPHVLRERAHLAALAGRRRRARRLFDRSLAAAARQGARAEALRTRVARGEVGRSLGWAREAEDGDRAARELEALLVAAEQRVAPVR